MSWTGEFHRARRWMAANALGLLAYLLLSSMFWAPYGEEGLLGGAGDPVVWVLLVLPVLVLFFLINLVWAGFSLRRAIKARSWQPFAPGLLILLFWVAIAAYNGAREYTGSEVYPELTTNKTN